MELVGSPDGGEEKEKEGLAVADLVLRALLVKEGEEEGEVEGFGELEAREADAVSDLIEEGVVEGVPFQPLAVEDTLAPPVPV